MAREKKAVRRPSFDDKTAVETAVELVPQRHGGALANGGYRGNKGGGRPTSELREAFRGDLEEMRAKVLAIANRQGEACNECGHVGVPADATMIAIFEKFAKYGIGVSETVKRDELVGILRRMWGVVVMHNGIEDPTDRLTAIQCDWRKVRS